ncbi:MAG TPA: type I-D CRISPR-associated protein Cas5/Csc1, partial [Thermotogota bacterium]|nr:type I-D CRISPR-associated protein Cas5/Csc1 [Thermotogota bacterium]
MFLYRCILTVFEPLFFASKEVGNHYITEPILHNYALAYALGLTRPYHMEFTHPRYENDLAGCTSYVTPGKFT